MADEPTPSGPDDKQEAPDGQQAPAQPAPPTEPVPTLTDEAQTTPPEAEPEPPAPAEQPAAEEPPAAEPQAPADAPSMPAPPAADAEPETASPPAAEQPAAEPEQPAAEGEQQPQQRPQGKKRDRPRRDRGQGGGGGGRPRRDRGPRQPQQQRASGPLPFQELRDAATAVIDLFGARQALRDAFAALGDKERRDLSRLVAEDGDWRVRARNIAAGSLGAGRVGKALAAQQISMARVEDLWPLTLSREEAAERQARVRNARRRDERRAQRDQEREQRSDRVSRADLEKAQDGRVGAQIRIVIGGQRDRRRKGEGDEQPAKDEPTTADLLDRLGY
jgi:hypothetical protein